MFHDMFVSGLRPKMKHGLQSKNSSLIPSFALMKPKRFLFQIMDPTPVWKRLKSGPLRCVTHVRPTGSRHSGLIPKPSIAFCHSPIKDIERGKGGGCKSETLFASKGLENPRPCGGCVCSGRTRGGIPAATVSYLSGSSAFERCSGFL